MPLRLTVSIAKKVGLPGFGSAGATCGVELEAPASLLAGDPARFRARARRAFAACEAAVAEELARLAAPAPDRPAPVGPPGPGATAPAGPRPAGGRPAATPKQCRLIRALAARLGSDLEGLLRDEHGVARPEDLSPAEASRLIDRLRAVAAE